jgi:hypothetical protein
MTTNDHLIIRYNQGRFEIRWDGNILQPHLIDVDAEQPALRVDDKHIKEKIMSAFDHWLNSHYFKEN